MDQPEISLGPAACWQSQLWAWDRRKVLGFCQGRRVAQGLGVRRGGPVLVQLSKDGWPAPMVYHFSHMPYFNSSWAGQDFLPVSRAHRRAAPVAAPRSTGSVSLSECASAKTSYGHPPAYAIQPSHFALPPPPPSRNMPTPDGARPRGRHCD